MTLSGNIEISNKDTCSLLVTCFNGIKATKKPIQNYLKIKEEPNSQKIK